MEVGRQSAHHAPSQDVHRHGKPRHEEDDEPHSARGPAPPHGVSRTALNRRGLLVILPSSDWVRTVPTSESPRTLTW